ncbi:hypothetical protein FSP39_007063 [Pinctada imbricata]|uniref:HECT domain-containing protein n=1 Tax=Pinctada imbricata TaxID=66713 RepID=A0AA88XFD4_PINIB|nr:hypothetical protein FSP39_007063 [Pinctada imbricata]
MRGMTDNDLAEFLPNKGDIFALRSFLSNKLSDTKSKKLSLMDKLRDRLETTRNSKRPSKDDEVSSRKKIPKFNAKKQVHRVDLGWYHFNETKGSYSQVREKFGGGTRTLLLDKKMNKTAVIQKCLELFFPDGESRHGSLSDMIVDLTDFQLKPLPDEATTIGDMIDKAKLHKIRFYLNTKMKKTNSSEKVEIEDEEMPVLKFKKSSARTYSDEKEFEIQVPEEGNSVENQNTVIIPSTSTPVHSDSTPMQDLSSNTEQSYTYIENDINGYDSIHTDGAYTLDIPNVWEDSLGEVAFTRVLPTLPVRDPRKFDIVVHRGHMLQDLITFFKDNTDVDFRIDTISVQIILPNGDKEQAYDDGGVMRDMLTEFWADFYEQCTTGQTIRVPCLRHDFQQNDWKAVARILAMGWIMQRMLPIRLAPSFLKSSLFGSASESVREEFLLFIPPGEQKILKDAIEKFDSVDQDELIEVLSIHESKVRATNENIGTVVDQIAHLELVQETAFVRECFFEVLMLFALNIDVDLEYSKMEPSSKKILSILVCEESESESFKHLKRYIREMDTDLKMLRCFLRFVTASDLLLYDKYGKYHTITVNLVDLTGISRRPVAHTCGRVLEIPKTYESYVIFKCEMNAVLNSNVWVMDIA